MERWAPEISQDTHDERCVSGSDLAMPSATPLGLVLLPAIRLRVGVCELPAVVYHPIRQKPDRLIATPDVGRAAPLVAKETSRGNAEALSRRQGP